MYEHIINRLLALGCSQVAVYWSYEGESVEGTPQFSQPQEIMCRWESASRLVRDLTGEEIFVEGSVIVRDVESTIKEGDALWLGRLESLSEEQKADPWSIATARRVRKVKRVPLWRDENKNLVVAYL